MFATYKENSSFMKWPSLTAKIGKRRKKIIESATGWTMAGVARLFFSRAKFEDSLFDEGLKIWKSA